MNRTTPLFSSPNANQSMKNLSKKVFEGMAEHHVLEPHIGRGALPDAALQAYVASVPPDLAHHTFSLLKDIHATALINAEALRKLVKKFDKKIAPHNGNGGGNGNGKRGGLSARLLPELYASNFTGSLASLEGGLALLRILLNIDDEEEDVASAAAVSTTNSNSNSNNNSNSNSTSNNGKNNGNITNINAANPSDDGDGETDEVLLTGSGYFGNRHNKEAVDAELVKRRKEELEWLRNMIASVDPIYIPHLVAHRGFHSPLDRSDVRPLENSLTAYEAAWTNGLHLCECDIALTKDERIILAHDENFARLGMDPTSPLCNKTVRDLTFKELMNCPIKSGARPPLLFDVLRSAAAIGGDAKMVVEIKAGNMDAGTSLARIFLRHPQLMDHVAIVMSFDAFIMHNFRREMTVVYEHLHGGGGDNYGGAYPQQQQPIAHRRETSITVPNRILSHDNELGELDNPLLPPKAPVHRSRSNTLGSSPHLGQTKLLHSNGRLPSMLGGGHKRIDSQDLFGLGASVGSGWNTSADNGSQFGLNLADLDATMMSSSPPTSTFLPNIRRSVDNLHHQQKSPENREARHPSPMAAEAAAVAAKDGGCAIKSFPKILLLTVDDTREPDDHHQFVDFTKPDKVAKLLRGGDGGSLDGVYMQYQKEMITPKGSKAMRNLAAMCHVGVWGTTPDDWSVFCHTCMRSYVLIRSLSTHLVCFFRCHICRDTFHTLVNECHVSYVNTDLPRHFRRKMKRSISANSLAMNGILARH
jgi:glycerophosphoryl diester phosphodiesterase